MQVERISVKRIRSACTEDDFNNEMSGERVSNTWVTCPEEGDNTWKQVLIPHNKENRMVFL